MEKNKIEISERVALLKKVSIFIQTEEKLLEDVAKSMTEIFYKENETIFKKGEVGKDMYIIIKGSVKVHDKDYIFAVLREEEVFGEYSILGEKERNDRSASVTVLSDTHLLKLDETTFYELLSDKINIIKGILAVLLKRTRTQNFFEEKLAESNDRIHQQKKLLREEKEKTDKLLLNILPEEVAEELKQKGSAGVRSYHHASVLFADVKGFTKAAERLSSEEVVKKLEVYFTSFDEITLHNNAEKIKTIGDAYMCAGGIPIPNQSNPIDLVLIALQMQNFMQEQLVKDSTNWQLRVGINTGSLIAGVIGKTKFAYDVWGDTVNTASRMESAGEVGKVNVSDNTYQFIKPYFECESRGEIAVKGKGKVSMYFVNCLKAKYAVDDKGILPNQALKDIIYQLNN